MAALTLDRPIGGEGATSEGNWTEWLDALRPPPVQLEGWLSAAQRLVIVSPHPDDEVLGCGGLIAMHAARGGMTQIVAVTDGEASHPGDPDWSADTLATARRRERTRGLQRLGVASTAVTQLALPDGAVAKHTAALERALRSLLTPADCVVATGRLDGHPDHESAGRSAAGACAVVGCRLVEAPVWLWHWATPDDPRVPWTRLRALPLSAEARASKLAALAEHATQLEPRAGHDPVLGPAIRARAARADEYFFI